MEDGAVKIGDGAEAQMERARAQMRKEEPSTKWKSWEEEMRNYHT